MLNSVKNLQPEKKCIIFAMSNLKKMSYETV